MTLHVLLPAKEIFTEHNKGAVATVVRDSLIHSRFREQACVFGSPIKTRPIAEIAYHGMRTWQRFAYGRNIGLGRAYVSWLKRQPKETMPHLIEVHGRPNVAQLIAKAMPHIPVTLFQHNDIRDMKGGRSLKERRALMRLLAGVLSNSAYIEQCLKAELSPDDTANCLFSIISLAAPRTEKKPARKKKTVLFVGRMVAEKGGLEAAQAAVDVLPAYPDWRFIVIGGRRFKEDDKNDYTNAIRKTLTPLGKQAEVLGFLPSHEVEKYQAEAGIILAPSQWQEPAGLTVLEALARGCALITTRRGGIPEYAEGRAILLDDADSKSIATALDKLLKDSAARSALQQKAWQDYPFTIDAMTQQIDTARAALMRPPTPLAQKADFA